MSNKHVFVSRVFLPHIYRAGAFRGLGGAVPIFRPLDIDADVRVGRALDESFTYRPRAAVDDGYILRRNK